jgi:hypothetical protein
MSPVWETTQRPGLNAGPNETGKLFFERRIDMYSEKVMDHLLNPRTLVSLRMQTGWPGGQYYLRRYYEDIFED